MNDEYFLKDNMYCTSYTCLLWHKKDLTISSGQTDFKYTVWVFPCPLFYFKALFLDFIHNDGPNKKIRMIQAVGELHFGP